MYMGANQEVLLAALEPSLVKAFSKLVGVSMVPVR